MQAEAEMRGDNKSSRPLSIRHAIDLAGPWRQSTGVRVFRVENGRRLRGKPVRCSEKSAKAGAAPATVNGELLSIDATGAKAPGRRGRSDDPQARRPAPTVRNVHGRGVPRVRLLAVGEFQQRASGHPPIPIGEEMSLFIENQPSGNGKPESVFISWLLWQPRGADLAVEALKEVQKLSRYENPDPDIARLKALFASLAGADGPLH